MPLPGVDRMTPGFDAATVPHIVALLLQAVSASPDVAEYYRGVVRPLLEHDRARSGNLMGTLSCYLFYAGNATRAAKALYLHRSTLLHRLGRIATLTSLDLSDPYARLALWIGVLLSRSDTEGD
jgi:DNA-binding PucR family transcriptional regulator